MASKQVVGLFDNMDEAQRAVQALRDAGFASNDISLVANNTKARIYGGDTTTGDTGDHTDTTEAAEGAGAGATAGTILGGLTGLLVGLGALVIPGVGPVIAAGTIATALGSAALGAGIGAASGGLLGALVGAGIPEEDANVYAEGIRRGGALLTVQADDANAERAADIMDQYGVVDMDQRGQDYRQGGWSRFDESTGGPATTSAPAGTTHESATAAYDDSSKVGTVGGGAAGAMTGAAIGAVGGPVGAAIGGIAGALAGGTGGAVADTAGKELQDHTTGTADSTSSDYGRTSTPTSTANDYSASTAPRSIGSDYSSTSDTGSGTHESATAAYDDSSKVGTVGGGAAGAMTGAAIGAVGGPVGAAIGGVAGALVGGTGGAVADTAGKEVQDHTTGTTGSDVSTSGSAGSSHDYTTRTIDTTPATADTGRPLHNLGNRVEADTGLDLDRDNDVGQAGSPHGEGLFSRLDDNVSNTGMAGTGESATEAYDDSSKIGTVGGGAAGAMTGAAMGAVGGPVGALIGGVAGAVVGGTGGAVADTAGKEVEDHATGTTGSTYTSEPGYTGRTGSAGHASDSRGSGEPTTGVMGSDTLDDGSIEGNIRRATDPTLDPQSPNNNI